MIPFIRPMLPGPECWVHHLAESYGARRFSNFGPLHERFAQRLSQRYGGCARVAVPVASATAGLTAVLQAVVALGAKVIVPSFTFAATVQSVWQAGCTPVFCDVDPLTWELSPIQLERLLAAREVHAVMPVRAYGLARDLSALQEVCERYGVPMVVDAAAALGGRLSNGIGVGHQGTAEVFSLHATKVFGIGEGGVVLCPPELAEKIRSSINFGFDGGTVVRAGSNGKLSEFAAAVGLAMLECIDEHIENRRRYARYYQQALAPLVREGLIELARQPGLPPYQSYPLQLTGGHHPDAVVNAAAARGLELRRYYAPAMHLTPAFRASHDGSPLPVTEHLAETMVCLPLHSQMEEATLAAVCNIVKEVLCTRIRKQAVS